ncbi:hypothetical protein GE21DRAFT_4082 [Neurospora crassa]|uniref:Uncharacterized protein n=1 Tax=Neurospora crassa (strain ATCC 24698 / 74-OR23-1A / CBS 708.71 / DSM 1257 / FGSC 987) TaxID=367110 RepID=Q7RYW4_NEUCR|nr:hypothetical protein NCU06455 [Neurospora crassa OR74A]EAA28110.1 hypothetical protein NCU06455 [Neurospora crassa OR74A]KHE85452.1 hypothetical protein GE21DRAFT_4082 [Neurospora crassa]|eukprot:XP_957346.1 hypothetical protein NCU06455 [Neurospora crassa OR74A]
MCRASATPKCCSDHGGIPRYGEVVPKQKQMPERCRTYRFDSGTSPGTTPPRPPETGLDACETLNRSKEGDVRESMATAMSIRVAVDDAVMDGVVVNGGNCSVRGELPTVVPSPATGQIYVKGTEFGDGRQCNRPAGVRQIPCKFHPCRLADAISMRDDNLARPSSDYL